MENTEFHSKKNGKRLIIHSLRTPKTLQEIYQDLQKKDEKKKPLTKSTILYHLGKLVKQGFVKFDEQKRYVLIVSEDYQKAILDALRKRRTINELVYFFKKKSDDKQKNKDLEKLEDLDYLRELLDVFFDQDLLTNPTTRDQYNPGSKEVWQINWLGCSEINACMVCKNYFEPTETTGIAQTIRYSVTEGPDISTTTVLIHNRCFHELKDPPWEVNFDFCDFCGLPLSKKRLKEWMHKENKNSILQFIQRFFTQNENYIFYKWIRNEVIIEFEKQFSIKINEDYIVIPDSTTFSPIGVFIDKIQADEIVKKFSGYQHRLLDHNFKESRYFFEFSPSILNRLVSPSLANISSFFNSMHVYALKNDVSLTSGSTFRESSNYSEKRGKEVFSQLEAIRSQNEQIISNFFGGPLNQMFSQMEPDNSDFYDTPGLRIDNPYATEMFLEDSLINIKNGKRYHPYCFEKINNSSTSSKEKEN